MEKVLFEDRGLTEKVTFEQRPEGGGRFGDTGGSSSGRGNSQGKGPAGETSRGQRSWSTASSR